MNFLFAVQLFAGVSAHCVEGLRNDPLLIVRDSEKKHYVYYMPNERAKCALTAKEINDRSRIATCGCKIIKTGTDRDKLRLRCLRIKAGKVYSRTTGIYYYDSKEVQARCDWMSQEVEKQLNK